MLGAEVHGVGQGNVTVDLPGQLPHRPDVVAGQGQAGKERSAWPIPGRAAPPRSSPGRGRAVCEQGPCWPLT